MHEAIGDSRRAISYVRATSNGWAIQVISRSASYQGFAMDNNGQY